MTSLEQDFVRGLVKKTLILGLLSTAAAFAFSGTTFGLSVLAGSFVTVVNLRSVQWITGKLVDGAKNGNINPAPWTALLVIKMSALFGVIWLLLTQLDLDAIGLIIGFSSFLPAIGWQAWTSRDDIDSSQPPEDA